FSAIAQADIINTHALNATDGATYAELGALASEAQEAADEEAAAEFQAQSTAFMNASFHRASLFTSVASYGVATLVIRLVAILIFLGLGMNQLAKVPATPDPTRQPVREPVA